MANEIHICLKIGGEKYETNREKIAFFHRVAFEIDRDWPWASSYGNHSYKFRKCEKCGGRVYITPKMSPNDIKKLGRQLGLRVKIKRFALIEKCYAGATPPKYVYPGVPGYEKL